jgi:O-antigen/teichoic acid export membrane protein
LTTELAQDIRQNAQAPRLFVPNEQEIRSGPDASDRDITFRPAAPQSPQYDQETLVRAHPGSRSLSGNFAWGVAGYAGFAACQWGILVVLAKLGNAEMVGRFALGLAVTAPIIMFSNLHLQAVIRTDTRAEYQLGDYLGLRVITTAIAIAVIAIVVLAIGYPRATAMVILTIGLAKSVQSISDVVEGFFQLHERMDRVTQSRLLKGIASVAAMGIAIYLTHSVLIGVVALAFVWAVVLIGFDLFMAIKVVAHGSAVKTSSTIQLARAYVRPRWDPDQLKKLALLATPLGVGALLSSIQTNAPRYVVERSLGEEALGVYAGMAYIMIAGTMVMQALGESASPRLAAYYDDGDLHAYRSLLLKLIAFGTACGLVGIILSMVAGQTILRILYSEEFAHQAHVMTWLAIAACMTFVSAFLLYGLTASQRFRSQAPSMLLVLVVTVVGSILLVPSFGLAGAAYAQVAAGAISVLVLGILNFAVLREMSTAVAPTEVAPA